MNTHTGGGFKGILKRLATGSSVFVTDYTYTQKEGYGRVAFAETFPSKIIPIRLDEYNGSIVCKKGTYICSSPDIDVSIYARTRFGAGLFGGEGFLLQNINQTSPGQTVLLRAGGSIITRTLRDGEMLKVTKVHFYEIEVCPRLGSGIRKHHQL